METLEDIINEIAEFHDCEVESWRDTYDDVRCQHSTEEYMADGVQGLITVEGVKFEAEAGDRDEVCKELAHQITKAKLDHIVIKKWEADCEI